MAQFRKILSLFSLVVLAVVTVVLGFYISREIKTRGKAEGILANIVIDRRAVTGPMPRSYMALAQGGEGQGRMLKPALPQIKELSPRLIRLDHLYDQYSLVKRRGEELIFDFTELDKTVGDILSAGALPFLSLSYMPAALSDEITGQPRDWKDWEKLVQATVEHYSSRQGLNLTGVYYEVWNEPDLFGRWSLTAGKDYRLLYQHSLNGALSAGDVNSFYIGGPAITGPYPNWLRGFLNFVSANNLRLDFLSWHRYTKMPETYLSDGRTVRNILESFPAYKNIQTIISEWSYDSENNPAHDSGFGAVYDLASVKQMLDADLSWSFAFEIKDGEDPAGNKFWGRWGLLTHEQTGIAEKPRYRSLKALTKLKGQRLRIVGEGTWVEALAALDKDTLRAIIFNRDSRGAHAEAVPVKFTGLDPGDYSLTEYLNGTSRQSRHEIITQDTLATTLNLNPNDFVLLELTRLTPS